MGKLISKAKLNTKMGTDIAWNMVSMVFVALAGVIYNTVFVLIYDPSSFGLFNQAMVYFLIFSQVTVFGVHFSVLKYVSEFCEKRDKRDRLITSAIISTLSVAILVVGLLFLLAHGYNRFVGQSAIITMLTYAFPALIFFALNKVLLNFLNAIRAMRAFALFQSLRYILIVCVLLVFGFIKLPVEKLMLLYLISEFILFSGIVLFIRIKKLINWVFDFNWFKEHLVFGSKVFLGSAVVDLNAKMDIVVLGFFVSDYIVGIYAFAIMFADGFYQILVVLRRNINPLITQYTKENMDKFHQLKNTWRKRTTFFAPVLAAVILVGYWLICMVLSKQEYLAAIVPFAIVIFGKAINGYYIVMGNTMNQTGYPKHETLLNVITIGANTLLNFILIPRFGMYGAAVATAISFFIFSLVLHNMTKSKLNINLLSS